MTVLETALVFVGIPLAIMGVLALFTLGVGGNRAPRYRPGQPFEFTPVWFLAAPPVNRTLQVPAQARPGRPEVRTLPALGARRARALPAGSSAEPPAAQETPVRTSGPKGGARGNW
jgi:hypothetical protein